MKTLKKRKTNYGLWLLALPALITIFVMNYMPLPGLVIAFKNYNYGKGILGSEWVGFDNFKYLFTSDIAKRITGNTLKWNFIFIISTHFFAIIVAMCLNQLSRRAVKLFQTVFFFPHFISWVIAAYLGTALFSVDKGMFNHILVAIGKEPISWYTTPEVWKYILPVANLWKRFGYSTIMYYTALLSFDVQLYEAADLEGANGFQKAIYITLPQLKQLIALLMMMDVGKIFRADFGLFYQFTKDSAPLYPMTDVIDTFVYRSMLVMGDPGMAAAAGFYQSVVGLIVVLVSNKLISMFDEEVRVF